MANEKPARFVAESRSFHDGTHFPGLCGVGDIDGAPLEGALLFYTIDIDKNESIDMAQLVFKYSEVGAGTGDWKHILYGIDEDNTASFGDPFGRAKTTASITINEGQPSMGSGATKTYDVKSIINEITSRSGWSRNNRIGFLFFNSGSSANVNAFANTSTTYLVYRISALPNFKPTPKSNSAPALPAAEDWGIKISKPGQSVLTATESQLYQTTRQRQFKVFDEDIFTSTSTGDFSIAHNLGYKPFATVFVKENVGGSDWQRLPMPSVGDHPTYYVTNTHLFLHSSTTGDQFYYRIFVDQIT